MDEDTRTGGASIYLLLGRLDGKMDTLLATQVSHSNRMEAHDKRLSEMDSRLTTLEADKANNRNNKTYTISIISIFIAAAAAVKGWWFFK